LSLNDEELTFLVQELSIKEFGWPFEHKAIYNKRLRTTGGRYLLATHMIEINPKVEQIYGTEELIGVIKHELCHYHLHRQGKGYKHQDQDFKTLLKKTNAPRYCRPLEMSEQKKPLYIFQCSDCLKSYSRKIKMNTERYRCGVCGGEIVLM